MCRARESLSFRGMPARPDYRHLRPPTDEERLKGQIDMAQAKVVLAHREIIAVQERIALRPKQKPTRKDQREIHGWRHEIRLQEDHIEFLRRKLDQLS